MTLTMPPIVQKSVDYLALNTAQSGAEHDPFTLDRYRQFARHLAPDTLKILDVGCATGRGGAILKAVRPSVMVCGLDCLEERLDQLPDAYSEKICGLTTDIPVSSASFDGIVAGEFIEHLTYGDGILTLKEFRRVIRDGGQLLMTTPNPDYFYLALTGKTTVGGAHLSCHYPKQLAVMMNEAGFSNTHYCGSGRVSRFLGENFPFIQAYGSFLIFGTAVP